MLRLLVFSLSWRLKISAATKVFNEDVKRKRKNNIGRCYPNVISRLCVFSICSFQFSIDLVVNR